jgi:hypothetical protein
MATYLWQSNPIAKKIIELLVDYTIGEDVVIVAKDKAVQSVIDRFWTDHINNWPHRKVQFAQDLFLYGEALLELHDEAEGLVRVANIYPRNIKRVFMNSSYPDVPIEVELDANSLIFAQDVTPKEKEQQLRLKLVIPVATRKGTRLRGEAFLFQINRSVGATRGLSDLFSIIDLVSQYEDSVYELVKRLHFANQWFYDITLEGANQNQINEFSSELAKRPPRPGAVRVHNERVKWNEISPKLTDVSSMKILEDIHAFLVTALGLPAHWTGIGGSMGRSAATEAQEPIFKHLQARQNYIRDAFRKIVNYQLDYAVLSREISEDVDTSFKILMPPIDRRNLLRMSSALTRIVSAIQELTSPDNQIISREEARSMIFDILKQMGLYKDVEMSWQETTVVPTLGQPTEREEFLVSRKDFFEARGHEAKGDEQSGRDS